MKKLVGAFMVLTLAIAACKKSDDNKGGSEALSAGKWQITSAIVTMPLGAGNINLMDSMSACQKDNFYMFNSDASITMDEGATKCNSSDPQTITDGNWSLQNGNKQLSISGSTITQGYGNLTFDVKSITSSTLQLHKDTTILGFTGSIDATLTNMK